jgi:hypothetical protein
MRPVTHRDAAVTWQDGRVTGLEDSAGAAPAPPAPAVIMPTGAIAYWTTGLTVVVAGLLGLAAFAGTWAALACTLAAVVLLAWGWPALLDLPSPRGTTATVTAGGAAAALAVALTHDEPRLQWLALALAGAVVAEFVHQLLRRDARPRLVESVTGTVAGVVVLASLSSLLALPATPASSSGVVTWGAAVCAALATQLLPLPARITLPLAVVVAGLLGGVLGGLFADGTVVAGLVVGTLCATVTLMVHRLLATLPTAGRAPGWLALAVAPAATSGMVAYVVLRLMVG